MEIPPAMMQDDQQIHHDLANLDKRVAVLETRAQIGEMRMERMDGKLDQISEMLSDHIDDENRTKGKLLASGFTAAASAIVAAIGTLAAWALQHT